MQDMKTLFATATIMAALAAPAQAAVVHDCQGLGRSINFVEPFRIFANGDIVVAHQLSDEVGAEGMPPDHLVIFVVSKNSAVGKQCFAISARREADGSYRGFGELGITQIKASYDEHIGLLLRVPVSEDGVSDNMSVIIQRRPGLD
jgi:hypothetical protein